MAKYSLTRVRRLRISKRSLELCKTSVLEAWFQVLAVVGLGLLESSDGPAATDAHVLAAPSLLMQKGGEACGACHSDPEPGNGVDQPSRCGGGAPAQSTG